MSGHYIETRGTSLKAAHMSVWGHPTRLPEGLNLNDSQHSTRLSFHAPDQFRRGDSLPYVPLRVIRNVHQQSAQCGRQLFLPDHAFRSQVSRRQRTQPVSAARKSVFEFRKKFVATYLPIQFTSERRNLRLSQLPSFGVRQQPVHAPCDVPQMKRNRWQSARACFWLLLRQGSAPFFQILLRQL